MDGVVRVGKEKHFPGALREEVFVDESSRLLTSARGFSPDNTLACVGVCRDEICHTLTYAVHALWGWPFGFSALAGRLFVGRTGFAAARRHAPIEDDRERYVFFVGSHIGIGAGGELGVCSPIGRAGASHPRRILQVAGRCRTAELHQTEPATQAVLGLPTRLDAEKPDLVRFLTDDPKQLKKYESKQRQPQVAVPTAQEIRSQMSQPALEIIADWPNGQILLPSSQQYISELAKMFNMDERTLLGILSGQ